MLPLSKYITSEGVFVLIGAVWFVVSAVFPVIPSTMPLGIPIPGFENIVIQPGIFIGVALVPVLMKIATTGKTPFVSNKVAPEPPKSED